MKYQHLKKQNESFIKQIQDQEEKIKTQRRLIDRLTVTKIDLLSKLEIQGIGKNKLSEINQTLDDIFKYETAEFKLEDRRYYYDEFMSDFRIIGEDKTIESWFGVKKEEIEKDFMLYNLKK